MRACESVAHARPAPRTHRRKTHKCPFVLPRLHPCLASPPWACPAHPPFAPRSARPRLAMCGTGKEMYLYLPITVHWLWLCAGAVWHRQPHLPGHGTGHRGDRDLPCPAGARLRLQGRLEHWWGAGCPCLRRAAVKGGNQGAALRAAPCYPHLPMRHAMGRSVARNGMNAKDAWTPVPHPLHSHASGPCSAPTPCHPLVVGAAARPRAGAAHAWACLAPRT